eukprot:scaffold132927_cov60-Phaeocystis_antarctica.AAC.1
MLANCQPKQLRLCGWRSGLARAPARGTSRTLHDHRTQISKGSHDDPSVLLGADRPRELSLLEILLVVLGLARRAVRHLVRVGVRVRVDLVRVDLVRVGLTLTLTLTHGRAPQAACRSRCDRTWE